MTRDDPRGGMERIRDAAVLLFGEQGASATSLKAIAAEAGVSQALIVHHYGTKEGLRRACDDHVAAMIRTRKEETLDDEAGFDPFVTLRRLEDGRPLLRYLIRALTEGGEQAAHLVDEMVTDAEDYMTRGERDGLIKPSRVPHDRSALLVIWSLGALVLHEHVHRLLGVDFLAESAPPDSLTRYLHPAMELYTQGLLQDGAFERLSEVIADDALAPPLGSLFAEAEATARPDRVTNPDERDQ